MSTTLQQSPCIPELQPVLSNVSQWLFGLTEPVEQCLIALLSGSHVLLEGPPGTAKTLLVKLLAQSFKVPFNRVQFTADLMPADITGTHVYNAQTQAFTFSPGPIMTTFLLADEINRAPAKTQSALLEAMQEYQVSLDGKTFVLPDCFTVFATQNPIEQHGTYPLPEAQLDRFLFKIQLPYPKKDVEVEILKHHHQQLPNSKSVQVAAVMDSAGLLSLRQKANDIKVEDSLIHYVAELVQVTREHPSIALGASPRASVLWLRAAKACACLRSRDYLIPDDIKSIAKPLLRHRLVLLPQAELEGQTTDSVIEDILSQVKVPR